MLNLDMIYHASFVLKDVVRKTNLVYSPAINPECKVYLKPENLQLTGSFKVRGAGYMISQLTEEEKAEQQALREEYLESFRAMFRGQLDNTVIQRPDGSRESLKNRNKK